MSELAIVQSLSHGESAYFLGISIRASSAANAELKYIHIIFGCGLGIQN